MPSAFSFEIFTLNLLQVQNAHDVLQPITLYQSVRNGLDCG